MLVEEKAEIAEDSIAISELITKKETHTQMFNRKTILKGAIWLGLLTIASVAAVFFYSHTGDTIKALGSIKFKYILICFVMVFIDLILGGWRNHILIRKLKPGLSQWVSFKANTANMFMGAITPFHSGASPAQLYVYNRHGVKVLNGFIVSLITMGATLLFMPLAGLLAIWAMNNQLESGLILVLLKYGFGVFFTFLLAFMLAFWKPLWIGSLLMKITGLISRMWPARRNRIEKWADRSYMNILNYQRICKKLLNDHPLLFPLSLLITVLLYLNKYCMQYVILLGLGVHADLLQVISIQILIQFMIYFAPSPGGSGFAEAGIAMLFSQIVPTAILPVFTLLQRSFLMLFPAMIGAFVVLKLLKSHAGAVGGPDPSRPADRAHRIAK
ncbi:flippase-like domain-containing protein [Pedobacter sp. MC2016-15]|uniref:lysylphosphatidylglycerol synthase transmembrane domain-containing protein n=1 Tax=Pedobacter sp. MC2016-15 TaxID=2994473 RepID=UPI00224866E5|nr:flippase-like domain-containing protein [Pedobacter sp. MC2016-15]MCX2481504.1 flippase-like domain-containing protein [Pedobacter sp. MC2016-15]